jgi:formate-dependent nitrite reductase membrane component NrfD
MSEAEVSRAGLEHVRPGREARVWSEGPSREDPHDHSTESYYGMPIINPPVWEEREIAGYLFTGGLAGASSLLAAGASLTKRPALARRSRICATASIGLSLAALIKDLGRPARFLHMLRVFKPTSPMNVGTWILVVYTPLNAGATASDLIGRFPRLGKGAGVGAGLLGAGVCSYTAALIADTAVPAWHEGHRELPFVFVGSAASAAAGYALIAAPRSEQGPARRLAILGAVIELTAEQLMERRLGMVAEALHTGTAGRRLKLAKLLSLAGIAGTAGIAPRSRAGGALAGVALVGASALTRFGVFAAGMQSASDPRYTVEPQRRRLAQA